MDKDYNPQNTEGRKRREAQRRVEEADKKFSGTWRDNNLIHKQGNSPREKALKDSIGTELRKSERRLVNAEIDRDFDDVSSKVRNEKKAISAKSDSLNRKMRDDTRNASLLDKQPGKSKREEFLRDSVSREYNKTASENMRNITRSTITDSKITGQRAKRDLDKMKARGDTANQSGDYRSNNFLEHNDVPLRKKKKK